MAAPATVPNEGDILSGTIVRIEPYGAFCSLEGYGRLQGLIHISQLSDSRVEKVEDVISVDDKVWIKVLNIDMDPNSQRWRIKLSMKDVSQDGSRADLGRQRESQDQQRSQLETNLNSMIGMGVARDPMADRLKMKHDNSTKTVFRGGYTLVADDEGEPDPAPVALATSSQRLAPVGRGRGATLPAWMTANKDGPTAASDADESESGLRRKDRKKRHKKHERKSDRKHKRESSRKERKRRHRDRGYSDQSSDESDDYSREGRKKRRRGREHRSRESRTRESRTPRQPRECRSPERV